VAEHGPLTVQVQDHWTLPFDGDALVNPELLKGIPGFEPRPNFAIELTRKLYTYNAINAAVCYLGAQAGYGMLADAANDEKIATVALAVGAESSAALIAEFGFAPDEQQEWCERALGKYQDETISDPIERNCRDPIRKLGLHDRILGPLHLCLEHGLPHSALAATLRNALAYREPSDLAAQTLQQTIAEHGEWNALKLIAPDIDARVESLLTPTDS
jgi:mannitol-1-phosphate 5-dehydrogenase